ncbi:MAG: DUF91 domain-containing protein [Dehalococcoidales bacterium]|nr:DUF91 domain-containing protein [Dehalococcoidales bacterium]
MRLFGIETNGKFKEFIKTPFQSNQEEAVLEEWLESNPEDILEDGKLLIIGRQVVTNFKGFIDLLAIDRQGDVVVLELKRDRTPRETLSQALEYASFVESLDWGQLEKILRSYLNDDSLNLAEYHRQYFKLGNDEAVSFNKDQRIVIVGQVITEEIRQTSNFLRKKNVRVTCLEFSFFESNGGSHMLSHDIVVGHEPPNIPPVTASLPVISKENFLESTDQNGKPIFSRILDLSESRSYPIHWGTKGFSLNVNLDGMHIAICFGYPPNSVYKQSIYTATRGAGGLLSKIDTSDNTDIVKAILLPAQKTGLFKAAGSEVKCVINRKFTEDEIISILNWIDKSASAILDLHFKR